MRTTATNRPRGQRGAAILASLVAAFMGFVVGVLTLYLPLLLVFVGIPIGLSVAAVSGSRPQLIEKLALLWCILMGLVSIYIAMFYFG